MSLLLGGLLGGGIGAGIGYANSRPGEGARGAVMGGLMGAGIGGGLGYGYSKAMPHLKKAWAADRAGRIASNKAVGGSVTQQVAKTAGSSKQNGLLATRSWGFSNIRSSLAKLPILAPLRNRVNGIAASKLKNSMLDYSI